MPNTTETSEQGNFFQETLQLREIVDSLIIDAKKADLGNQRAAKTFRSGLMGLSKKAQELKRLSLQDTKERKAASR